jgi:hypothetical protein
MSYRNPGNLNIGDPNAFLKAFLGGVEKYSSYFQQQAEKEERKERDLDIRLAKFESELNYPDIAKNYNPQVASQVKNIINEKYVDSGVFASSSVQDQAKILSDIGVNIMAPLDNMNKAVALDPTDVDLNLFNKTPVFRSFLENKQNGFEVVTKDNGLAFKFNDGEKDHFLTPNDVPDKMPTIRKNTEIFGDYDKSINDAVRIVDYAYQRAEDYSQIEGEMEKGFESAANKIFGNMDYQSRAAIFKKMLKDKTGEEFNYNDSPSDISKDEQFDFLEIQDLAIKEYIENTIRNQSAVRNKFIYEKEKEEEVDDPSRAELERMDVDESLNNVFDIVDGPASSQLSEYLKIIEDQEYKIENGILTITDGFSVGDDFEDAVYDMNTAAGKINLVKRIIQKQGLYTGKNDSYINRKISNLYVNLLKEEKVKEDAEKEVLSKIPVAELDKQLNNHKATLDKLNKLKMNIDGTFSLEGKNYTGKELDTIKEKLFQKINDISNIRNQNASQEFNSNN